MKYFKDCRTEEEVKKAFFEYAKQLHPDNGGDAEKFKKMKDEYEKAFEQYKGVHVAKSGETYRKETTQTAKQYADIIERIIHLSDITIEIIGSWVWVSGDTKKYSDLLKSLKFWYSASKKAWYFSGEPFSKRRGRYSMKSLRSKWGSQVVETEEAKKLTATA